MKRKIIRLIEIAYKVLFLLLGRMPVKKKVIVFESFLGKQYSDSPRAIYEYMKEKHPEYKMYWSMDRRVASNYIHEDIQVITRLSLKWVLVMSRANYWITNSRLPLWIRKPKGTVYVQTWHGTPLKKLGVDIDEVHMPGTNSETYKQNFVNEAKKWDYLISPNHYSTEIFKRAFRFKGEMIESGYPRNDYLKKYQNDSYEKKRVKSVCGIANNKKVILYAPTWRDNQFYKIGHYKFNLQLDLERLKESFQDEYVIILRLHYLVAENLNLSGLENFVYDFSHHSDISELYLISDLLITDYSSVFFDYANLNRPILFYVYDIEEYRDQLRGFYIDFESEAPGPLIKTTEEVVSNIKNLPDMIERYEIRYQHFCDKYCKLEDGEATKRVVERILHER